MCNFRDHSTIASDIQGLEESFHGNCCATQGAQFYYCYILSIYLDMDYEVVGWL